MGRELSVEELVQLLGGGGARSEICEFLLRGFRWFLGQC